VTQILNEVTLKMYRVGILHVHRILLASVQGYMLCGVETGTTERAQRDNRTTETRRLLRVTDTLPIKVNRQELQNIISTVSEVK